MGLDITAYKQLKVAQDVELDEWGEPKDWKNHYKPGVSLIWSEEHFPGRAEGIDANAIYTFDYHFTFCAGSYGGYNAWRNWLAALADGKDAQAYFDGSKGPFWELINFPDNEGVIGPIVSAKLADEFNEWYGCALLKSHNDQDDWNIRCYYNWMRAFELAADGGAVDFH